jgi:hypothetical protein
MEPIQCSGQPEAVERMAVLLASDEAAWITGAVFPVDAVIHLLSASAATRIVSMEHHHCLQVNYETDRLAMQKGAGSGPRPGSVL